MTASGRSRAMRDARVVALAGRATPIPGGWRRPEVSEVFNAKKRMKVEKIAKQASQALRAVLLSGDAQSANVLACFAFLVVLPAALR